MPGSGLETVNIFRSMLGLPQAEWKEVKEGEKQETPVSKQRTLADFLG